jgi:ribosomal-protein-alanine N-acetyltransferase
MPYILEYMQPEDIPEVARVERLCFSLPWPVSAYRRELRNPDTNRYIVCRYLTPDQARELGMPEPDAANLTALNHPWLAVEPNGSAPRGENGVGRSLIGTLLPWLRPGEHEPPPPQRRAALPIVGYAGLWLMVDEGHVTTIGVHPSHRGQGAGELLFLGLVDLARQLRAYRLTLEVRVSNHGAQALYRKYGLENAGVRRRYYSDNGEDAFIMWSAPLASSEQQQRVARLRQHLVERLRSAFDRDSPPSRPVDAGRLQ